MHRFRDAARLAAQMSAIDTNIVIAFWFDENGLTITCNYKLSDGADMLTWEQLANLPPRAVNDRMLALLERVKRPPCRKD